MSTNMPLNPFRGYRWEQDSEHIIYLPERLFTELERRQDIYLVGSRGTGKTTFLKALNWETRLTNSSIKRQIPEEESLFEKRYIGIYINAMSFGLCFFERKENKDTFPMLLYSLWAEVNILYRVIESIEGLFDSGHVDFTIEEDEKQCNRVYDYLSNLFGDTILDKRRDTNIQYNITFLKEIVEELPTKTIDERETLRSRLDSYKYGDLIKETVPYLVGLCDKKGDTNKWCTKICFDQIESAPNFHKIVNTFIARKLSERVWFIVSGLSHRDIDINQTYVHNHNLTNDDKLHVDLDKEFFLSSGAKQIEFNSLAEGICDLILKHADNNIESTKRFALSNHLGPWDMNEILDVFLISKRRISVNEDFEYFMKSVQENKDKYRTKYPPYIETYYYDILGLSKKWKGDLQKSREKNSDTGKKYTVIMLALLRHYKLKASTPYVGHRQIISLCNSTRDFLKIMEALFNIRMKQMSSKNISDFFSFEAKLTQREIEAQTAAVVKVANDKYEGIEKKYRNNAKSIERMNLFINTCGNILYDLQAKKEFSSLKSEEKGIFTVSFKDNKASNLHEFLKTAADDTYIRVIKDNTTDELVTVEFELTRLFAPKYKYSFRQGQIKIKLEGETLNELCTCETNSCKKIAKELIDKVENQYQDIEKSKSDPKEKGPATHKSKRSAKKNKSLAQQKTLF